MKEKIQQRYSFKFKEHAGTIMMISDVLLRVPIDVGDDVDLVHKHKDVNTTEKTIAHSIMNEDVDKVFETKN